MHPHKHQAKTGQQIARHRYAEGGEVKTIPNPAPLAPLSPYEQYNVSAGQGKTVGPMSKWGIKDMRKGD